MMIIDYNVASRVPDIREDWIDRKYILCHFCNQRHRDVMSWTYTPIRALSSNLVLYGSNDNQSEHHTWPETSSRSLIELLAYIFDDTNVSSDTTKRVYIADTPEEFETIPEIPHDVLNRFKHVWRDNRP